MAIYKWLAVQFILISCLLQIFKANNDDYKEGWFKLAGMIKRSEFCYFRCHEQQFRTVRSARFKESRRLRFSSERHCRCDDNCDVYGDCCFDAWTSKNRTMKKDKTNRFWACLPLLSSEDHLKEFSIYMINRCPVDWSGDKTLSDFCRRTPTLSNYSYLLDIPVFSSRTNVTYANIYCATCHSDIAHLAQWDISVECSDDFKLFKISKGDMFDPSNYHPGLQSWSVMVNGRSVWCSIKIRQFANFYNYLKTTASRTCLSDAIENCAANWTNPTVERRCNSYALHVQTTKLADYRKIYKNPHCAKCNYHTKMYCYSKSEDQFLQRPPIYSFAMLIDFNSGGNERRLQSGKCEVDQIYDHILERCYDIVCGSMFENKVGICVPKNVSQDDSFDWTGRGSLNSSCKRLNLQEIQDFFLKNGTLILNKTGQKFLQEEYELTADGRNASICLESYKKQYQFSKYSEDQSIFSVACLVISVVCLVLHIATHAILPKLHNLPGRNLLSLSCALFIAQLLFLTSVQFSWIKLGGYSLCAVTGILIHWSYLAAFFWMNVMSFDICRAFAGSLTIHLGKMKSDQRSTFRNYSLYAWSFPTVIVLLGMTLDYFHLDEDFKPLYNNHIPECWLETWAPAYGVQSCWISSPSGLVIHFVIPIAVLLLGNIIMFCITVSSIFKQRRAARFALEKNQCYRKPGETSGSVTDRPSFKNSNSKNNRTKTLFFSYVKLGLIMGLGWIFGLAAALANDPVLWYVFIFFNALQGFFIFVAFTFKRKVYYMIYVWATNKPHPNDSLSNSRATDHSNNKLNTNRNY